MFLVGVNAALGLNIFPGPGGVALGIGGKEVDGDLLESEVVPVSEGEIDDVVTSDHEISVNTEIDGEGEVRDSDDSANTLVSPNLNPAPSSDPDTRPPTSSSTTSSSRRIKLHPDDSWLSTEGKEKRREEWVSPRKLRKMKKMEGKGGVGVEVENPFEVLRGGDGTPRREVDHERDELGEASLEEDETGSASDPETEQEYEGKKRAVIEEAIQTKDDGQEEGEATESPSESVPLQIEDDDERLATQTSQEAGLHTLLPPTLLADAPQAVADVSAGPLIVCETTSDDPTTIVCHPVSTPAVPEEDQVSHQEQESDSRPTTTNESVLAPFPEPEDLPKRSIKPVLAQKKSLDSGYARSDDKVSDWGLDEPQQPLKPVMSDVEVMGTTKISRAESALSQLEDWGMDEVAANGRESSASPQESRRRTKGMMRAESVVSSTSAWGFDEEDVVPMNPKTPLRRQRMTRAESATSKLSDWGLDDNGDAPSPLPSSDRMRPMRSSSSYNPRQIHRRDSISSLNSRQSRRSHTQHMHTHFTPFMRELDTQSRRSWVDESARSVREGSVIEEGISVSDWGLEVDIEDGQGERKGGGDAWLGLDVGEVVEAEVKRDRKGMIRTAAFAVGLALKTRMNKARSETEGTVV
ncbi:hypothetical protein SAICODRAFT_5306 [Saitoella complicata NRRL Y-17804]|uniref:uncharacterized protein n=1 Tax=Saitoella complicata (strain BCRC 22490 / CBS 7301 / JCM 7358 / NBRC 10748 / NRRL Y-17804) TaxID=698492 RepID=UPI000867566C|nr:uncharacterized protein SAICODRAFT_5306 [Saitoella complicata NRRL Y-17804]ODQ55361.1 hypothetical protein SAICODRAFT_5306 [Saitoella complicata NRRL Y-17804]